MTAPIIPADQWPENAGGHVWDETGRGNWIQYHLGIWFTWPSDVPMPAGWDWRVPVMRPDTGNPVSAPAIDLGQYAVAIQYAINGLREAGGKTDNAVAQKLDRLRALIDGQAKCATCGTAIKSHPMTGTICDCAMQPAKGEEAITWGTQYPGKSIKLFGAREIAELNWYPDEGADLVGLRVVERVQPTKGEEE